MTGLLRSALLFAKGMAPGIVGMALCATASSAAAGDFADREILGFAPDGSYFAFEEYGVRDGSGIPYSHTFVIDTATDEWAQGTPIRIDPQQEGIELSAVRSDARRQARPILAKYGIAAAGRIVASNPATEASADPYRVSFYADNYGYQPEPAWSLTLTALPFPDPPGCENLGPTKGFRLVLVDPTGVSRTLHEDDRLPASRHCTYDYAIADVVTFFPEGHEAVIVVLLNTISQGFEGPDRRFLAVTSRFAAH